MLKKSSLMNVLVMGAALLVFVSILVAQNPVKPTPESLAKGKKTYTIDCAMCHNESGDGKNDMDMKNVPDLTNPEVQKKATDSQWFEIIQKGKGDMPPEGPRAKTDDDLWNLVNYIRTLAKK